MPQAISQVGASCSQMSLVVHQGTYALQLKVLFYLTQSDSEGRRKLDSGGCRHSPTRSHYWLQPFFWERIPYVRGAAPMLPPVAAPSRPPPPPPGPPWCNLADLRVDSPRAQAILRGFQIGTRAGDGSDAESAGEGSDAESLPPVPTAPPPAAAAPVAPLPPTGPPQDERRDARGGTSAPADSDAQLVVAVPPDVDVRIADSLLREWGVDTTLCSTVVDGLLAVVRPRGGGGRKAATHLRVRAGKVRERVKPLWTMKSVAARYADTFKFLSLHLTSPLRPPSRSFADIFSHQASLGYDVVRNRKIRWGDEAYKAFLLFACLDDPDVYENSCQAIATVGDVPSCGPSCGDTESSLRHMGALVECMYGVARGRDFHGLRFLHDTSEWRTLYLDSSGVFQSLNYLQCALHGGWCRRTNVWMHPMDGLRLPAGLPNSTLYLAAVAYLLVTRTDAP